MESPDSGPTEPADGATDATEATPKNADWKEIAQGAGLAGVTRYGRGAAFVDVNDDGWDDLFVVDTDDRHRTDDFGVSTLYENRRDGSFRPVDVGISPDDLFGAWVAAFADYDNDGDQDVLIGNGGYTAESSLVLYENRLDNSGGFVNVSSHSGISAADSNIGSSRWWGASWADYDNDGWLDAVVTRLYGRPLLLHNEGDGTFNEVAASVGLPTFGGHDVKNPVWLDFDADGDQDLYLAGMTWHGMYENRGIEGFTEITSSVFPEPFDSRDALVLSSTAMYPGDGLPSVFAAAAADFDQDGREDLYLGRYDWQDYIVFNNGDGSFELVGAEGGLDTSNYWLETQSGSFENTMGLGVGDLYDDGYPDVVVGSGNPDFTGPDVIFCNLGQRMFERCTHRFKENAGHELTRGHAPVFSDYDRDGSTDLFFNLGGAPNWDTDDTSDGREVAKLFVRQQPGPIQTARVTLKGTKSNRDAIGAKVTVVTNVTRYYFVRSTQGFQAQSSRTLLVALGESDSGIVHVDWPSGAVSETSVATGQEIHLVEP